MPTYEYVCCACGHRQDEIRNLSDRDKISECPRCDHALNRDVVASMRPHTDMGYQGDLLSEGLGISPDQIPEAMAKFPGHRYAPDGRMILRSHTERKRVLKELGFVDRDSYC